MSDLPKYKVYYNNYYTHSNQESNFTTEEINALQYGARTSKNTYSLCILYPGFDKTIKKVIDARNQLCDTLTSQDISRPERMYRVAMNDIQQVKSDIYKQSLIIVPPTKYFDEDSVVDMNVKRFENLKFNYYSSSNIQDFISTYTKTSKTVQKNLVRLLQARNYFDGRNIYRLLALVHFMSNEKDNKNITFGEYTKNNHQYFVEQALNCDFDSIPEEYNSFVEYYLNSRNALSFVDRALKKNEAIINSLTYDEIMKAKDVEISMSPNNYTRNLNNVVQDIRNAENTYTNDEIAEKLSHIIIDKSGKLELTDNSYLDRMKNAVSHVDSFINNDKTKNVTAKTIILQTIEKNLEDMTLMNILLLTSTNMSSTVFRSATPDKIVELLSTALSYYDEPIHFVRLITRLFFSQNGHIASYSEWMNYIKTSEKDEKFDLPTGIMVSFIVSREKTSSVRFEPNELLQDYYRNYAVQQDLSEM